MTDSDEDDFVDSKDRRTRGGMRDVSLSIPTGHVLVNRKWAASPLIPGLTKVLTVKYDNSLDFVDFQPASNTLVMFLSEADIICGLDDQTSKINKLTALSERKRSLSITWIYLMSELTSQYLHEFQQKIVLELSHSLIPVPSQDQVGQILQQLGLAVNRTNPFIPPKQRPRDERSRRHKDILHAVLKLPGMGEKKSRSLLEKFDSIAKISAGNHQELAAVLGQKQAINLQNFFDKTSS